MIEGIENVRQDTKKSSPPGKTKEVEMLMNLIFGALKYLVKNAIFNYPAMYIFGGTILSIITFFSGAVSGIEFIPLLMKTLAPTPSSLIINPLIGSPVAAFSWYIGMTG